MNAAVVIHFRRGIGVPLDGVSYYVVQTDPVQIVFSGVLPEDGTGVLALVLDTEKTYFVMAERAGFISESVRLTPEEGASYDVTLTPYERLLPRNPDRCRITGQLEYADGTPFDGTIWLSAPEGVAVNRSGRVTVGNAAVTCSHGRIDVELDRGACYLISGIWADLTSNVIYVPNVATADASDILVPYVINAYRTDTRDLSGVTLQQNAAARLSASLPIAVDLSDGRVGGVDLRDFIELETENRDVAAAALSSGSITIYGEDPGITSVRIFSKATYGEIPFRLPRVLIGEIAVEVTA